MQMSWWAKQCNYNELWGLETIAYFMDKILMKAEGSLREHTLELFMNIRDSGMS